MPACLFVGGPFHSELRHVSSYRRTVVVEGTLKATYVPCTMWSKRGSQIILRCMVDVDVAYDASKRLKLTLDALMRNMTIAEPWSHGLDETQEDVA